MILTGVVNCAIKSVVIHCAKMVENVETKHAFARRALLGKRATFVCALKTACPTVVALAMANVNVILDTRVKLCSIRYVVNGECSHKTKKCTCDFVDAVNATFEGQRYRGPACLKKTCPNNCTSATNGACQPDGSCSCLRGQWTGRDCSVPVCPNLCSGKGKCRQGACKCDEGYSGRDCSVFDEQYSCPKACSHRGACVNIKMQMQIWLRRESL